MLRLAVKNLNSSADWRGLIFAAESRDHPQDETADTTAALAYEAEDLTPLGGATEAERTGASGKVIRHANLTDLWQAILGSEIDEVGNMTHKGARRIWARIYDPASEAGFVELRLEWRALGSSRWSQNAIVSTPLAGGFAMVDLGECRPEEAAVGDGEWEWRITARSTGGAGADIDVDKVYVLPTEQYMVMNEPMEITTPTTFSIRDRFQQSAGALNGKKEEAASREYETSGETTDFQVDASEDAVYRETQNDISKNRVARVKGLEVTDAVAQLVVERPAGFSGNIWQYLVGRGTVELRLSHFTTGDEGTAFSGRINGSSKAGRSLPLIEADTPYLLTLATVGNAAYGWLTKEDEPLGAPHLAFDISSVEKGLIGFEDRASFSGSNKRRYYRDLRVWVPEPEAVCFAGRSIELRSDGVYRQAEGSDVWGRLVPEGFLPYASPSGLEGRDSRVIVVPTQGDLGELADIGSNKLSAVERVRPAFHFSREAS